MSDGYKILLVDDDEDILWIYQMILSDAGFSVEISNDSKAIEKINSEKFHIFILDFMMQKINGDELAKRIIKKDKTAQIIFLTGYSEMKTYLENIEGLTNVTLLKPITAEKLIEAVNNKIVQLDCFYNRLGALDSMKGVNAPMVSQ